MLAPSARKISTALAGSRVRAPDPRPPRPRPGAGGAASRRAARDARPAIGTPRLRCHPRPGRRRTRRPHAAACGAAEEATQPENFRSGPARPARMPRRRTRGSRRNSSTSNPVLYRTPSTDVRARPVRTDAVVSLAAKLSCGVRQTARGPAVAIGPEGPRRDPGWCVMTTDANGSPSVGSKR
jgi:hypothetical protein